MSRDNRGKISGPTGHRKGILARLRRDERGNTLAIMAAALIPMIGMVGSAVDISRAYLVKTRLQQACDAGVLAARRSMSGQSIANDTNAQTQATNFFNINLKTGAYGATVTPITVTDVNDANGHATGTVDGTASATVPTTLMRIFGKTSLTMNATCEAELQVANNDVMFVLDTTGSMNCAASDTTSTCSDNGLVEKSNARIKALRSAVNSFYTTLNSATTSGSQLRIGFVPYSTTVNVGYLLPTADIAGSWNYQSRVANFNTAVYTGVPGTPSVTVEVFNNGAAISSANCTKFGSNTSFNDANGGSFSGGSNPVSSGGPPPAATTSTSYSNTASDWGYTGAAHTSGSTSKSCRRTVTATTSTYPNPPKYKFTNWTIGSTNYTTSTFKTVTVSGTTYTPTAVPVIMSPSSASYSSSSPTPSSSLLYTSPTSVNEAQLAAADNSLTATSTTWGGCIEERQTTPGTTDFSTIPTSSYDLNIDMLPTTDAATQWRPWWPEIIWGASSVTSGTFQIDTMGSQFGSVSMRNWYACPSQAQKLTVTDASSVSTYVNSLNAVGFTYHDIGMLWGTRLISPTGLFSTDNIAAPNGKPINRHIIFMTDGTMEPDATSYNFAGHEYEDKRISGTTGTGAANLTTLHNARFAAICTAAKNMNITVWVIAYAQTMTTQLQNCASPGKAYYAGDDATLTTVFNTIASQIAELRLSR
ncbi:MAG TPA: TadE/TadG family type IV pilus assembly protein [Allosphingosinicella sp.]|jgi:Flp pilus assembly protein TadG|nr:TadE/TadG family type IV pilus assembly protein [Allosphingosinicella sp.]